MRSRTSSSGTCFFTPLPFLSLLQRPCDLLEVADVLAPHAFLLKGPDDPGDEVVPELEVGRVEVHTLGCEAFDELLGGSLVDLDAQRVPVLVLLPRADRMGLHLEAPCNFSDRGDLPRQVVLACLLSNLQRDPPSTAGYVFAHAFHHRDHLGNLRIVTDAGGWKVGAGNDYYPFGREVDVDAGNGSRRRFTGHERDGNTGMDYMLARYYGSNVARFTSPDPAGASEKTLTRPQRWNKYGYVLNNPLVLFDPNGEEAVQVTVRAFIEESTFQYPPSIGPIWSGDGRSFSTAPDASHRAQVVLTIETDPTISALPLVGDPVGSSSGSSVDFGLFTLEATADVITEVSFNFRDSAGDSVVGFLMSSADPLVPGAPEVGGTFTITVPRDASQVALNGTITPYPAWEGHAKRLSDGAQGTFLQYTPEGTKANTPGSLFGDGLRVSGTAHFDPRRIGGKLLPEANKTTP